jgi:hypothetical protein
MTEIKRKRKPWLKRIIIAAVIVIAALGGIYWYVATEKFADTSSRKAVYTVNAIDFLHEFEKDNASANAKYTEKIITVNGIVSEVEAADTTMNIIFRDTLSQSYAIFAFQEQHLAEAKSIKAGDPVSIKGSCSGGVFSPRRKITVISFKRCALNK